MILLSYMLQELTTHKLHLRHKKHTIFFYYNLKKSDPILIIFGTNISDTTGHQMTV